MLIKRLVDRQKGFTMIELIVALFVVSIGLLGLAALQTAGIRSVNDASSRTQAAFLASEAAEAMLMRSNGGGSLLNTFISKSSEAKYTSPDCKYSSDVLSGAVSSFLKCFYASVKENLPGGNAQIAAGATPGSYNITVGWVDVASNQAATVSWVVTP